MNLKQWMLATTLIGVGLVWNNSAARASGLPDGEYVLDSVSGDSSEEINDEQINTSASHSSGASGSASVTAHDDFYAGNGTDTISRSAGAWTNFSKTYQWQSSSGASPASYTYTANINYSGSCTAENGAQLGGSWSGGGYGGSIAPGDSSNANYSDTSPTQDGDTYISFGLSLSVSSSLDMTANQGSVSGSVSQTLDGSIDDPVY